MTLKFNANLDFQKEVIASIIYIFGRQETYRTNSNLSNSTGLESEYRREL